MHRRVHPELRTLPQGCSPLLSIARLCTAMLHTAYSSPAEFSSYTGIKSFILKTVISGELRILNATLGIGRRWLNNKRKELIPAMGPPEFVCSVQGSGRPPFLECIGNECVNE